jgi:hypothetical protein
MAAEIVEETPAALADYARVSIRFEVREVLDVVVRQQGLGGLELVERQLCWYKRLYEGLRKTGA